MSYNNYNLLNDINLNIKEEKLSDNIFLITGDTIFKRNTYIDVASNINGLLLTINLKGNITHNSFISDSNLSTKESMTAVNLIQSEQGRQYIDSNTQLKNLHIIFKKEFLQEHLKDNLSYGKIMEFFDNKRNSMNLKNSKTNLQNQIIANDIFNSPYKGDLNRIFLQSKVLEILVNELQEIDENKEQLKKANVKFSDDDKDAIYKARDIILENIYNPVNISDLSRKVALNDFKLKIGFNAFFNTSPYQMLKEYRMLKAKELLEQSDMNVSEISEAIGYKYVHNFSKVFTKRFGVRPKDIMKSRKYYY